MELFYELLLTAAASLIVAFLLAKLFSANDTRGRVPDSAAGPAAAAIAEEEEEEERIIEVDEVKGARAHVAAPVAAEEWVEVDKAAAAVAGEKAECLAEEEGVAAKVARELFVGAVFEARKEEGEVGEEECDLTVAAAAAAAEKLRDLAAEAAPTEVFYFGPEKGKVQYIGAERDDSPAEATPSEAPDAGMEKQTAEVTEAVEAKQQHLVLGAAPSEVLHVEPEEETCQAVQVTPRELASDIVHRHVIDTVFDKQEEQIIEVKQYGSAAEVAPSAIIDATLSELEALGEEAKEKSVDLPQEVLDKEEAKCEARLVDEQEELVHKEELMVGMIGDLENGEEGSSSVKVAAQLPEKEATLLGMPEDEPREDMEFGEWEGIERSDVEKRFGAAAAFAASDAGVVALSKLDSDLQLQLQGLLKVAIDGPCYDSTQPLTLRPSSRAKWVAWQKLGNMHPEIAMEKYMNLLSETIPGWMGDKTLDVKKNEVDSDSEGPILTVTAHTSDQHNNQGIEGTTSMDEGPLTSSPNPEKGRSSDIPAE